MRPSRRQSIATMSMLLVVLSVAAVYWTWSDVPESRAEMEDKMDRPFLAYHVWDRAPVAVFQWNVGDEFVYIDRLRLDWSNKGVPLFPSWQWTGMWAYVASTSDPASVGYGGESWATAFFGQVNDPAIVTIRCQMETYLLEESVSAPGFALKLLPGEGPPSTCDFLDALGNVIWTASVTKSTV